MAELIAIIIPLLGFWASVWYRLGKLQQEVKHHNQMLTDIHKEIEQFIIRR